ncbi:hypothetical protein HPB50_010829 [Hyalomma asiaticum]|uniref:Uncharacterized protein n=1 Tax=Hyalomma asiaticum TaxID=266040 RepID=A0ACB7RQR8_HYAAI|nr:hypothetical protein HPB50_010829 [Hyalomma asiaticum]
MAPGKRLYTLVDFAEDVDWKPLHFVKPLPKKRRCSVCELVRKATTVLSCGHAVCRCCYDQCEVEDECVCPIDGQNFSRKVKWRYFPTRNMLRRKVKCWNEAHGCTAVMSASQVSKHFHRDCQYHTTLCTRCSAMVLCSDMCEHLKSCRELEACNAADSQVQCDSVQEELAERVLNALEDVVGEIKELLEGLASSNCALHERISEICQSIDSLTELVEEERIDLLEVTSTMQLLLSNVGGIDEELGRLHGQCEEEFEQVQQDIEGAKEDGRACTSFVVQRIHGELSVVTRNVTRRACVIPEIASLEETAMMYGRGIYYGSATYLRGYNIFPCIALQKDGGHVFFLPLIELAMGELDYVLHWPFNHYIKCRFVHESTEEEYVLMGKPSHNSAPLQMPTVAARRFLLFRSPLPWKR